MQSKRFKSKHNLQLQVPTNSEQGKPTVFKVGTAIGTMVVGQKEITVYTLINPTPDNGHHEDALEWLQVIQREGMRKTLTLNGFTPDRFTSSVKEVKDAGFKLANNNNYIKKYHAKAKVIHYN